MTYYERITYLTGNFIQLSQYVLQNAFRFACLLQCKENTILSNDLLLCEQRADDLLLEYEFKGSEMIIETLQKDYQIAKKLMDEIKFILKKRDYVVSYFYIDNAKAFNREEVAVYESKINELNTYCDRAKALNQKLVAEADKIYNSIGK